jgi:catechol 2,3-dioxygenase-like lactoylglutathione lyase family enzyme
MMGGSANEPSVDNSTLYEVRENHMTGPSYILLYVKDPAKSAAFYTDLLGRPPVENSPTFALFALPSGLKIGLWSKPNVDPLATAEAGSTELAFSVESQSDVEEVYRKWEGRGFLILQKPVQLDFGYTFVATDPDGHRLRVFAPSNP